MIRVEQAQTNRVWLTTIMRIASDSYLKCGMFVVVGLLCVCVFVQMFDEPGILLNNLIISDILTESESEDPSLLPPVPELRPSGIVRLRVITKSSPELPVLASSIFHPPLT